ncbi:hypothetical protein IU405_01830 [Polaribacter sp. BAL334]|nr:hypothetical protein [Polaribacter sp. BAL334]
MHIKINQFILILTLVFISKEINAGTIINTSTSIHQSLLDSYSLPVTIYGGTIGPNAGGVNRGDSSRSSATIITTNTTIDQIWIDNHINNLPILLNANVTITIAENLIFNDANMYFAIRGTGVTIEGNGKTITLNGITNYSGLVNNGDYLGQSGIAGYAGSVVRNIGVISNNSSLKEYCGWIGQRSYGNGAGFSITNCYSTGDMTNTRSGGILGNAFMNGTISNCYSLGNISGESAAGIAATNNYDASKINNCYANGLLTGVNANGICEPDWESGSAIFSNCYVSNGTFNTTDANNNLIGTDGTVWNTNVNPYTLSSFTFTWNGTTNTVWNTASNWSLGSVPTSIDDVSIPSGLSNYPIIPASVDVTVNNITIASGASLTLSKGTTLSVIGNFTNTGGTVTLNSDSDEFSSLLVSGTTSGNITYNRYVNSVSGGWDLIGSPVSGLPFSTFIQNANIATNGSFYAVGSYDNTNDTWTNATNATSGNLQLGQGYQMATTAITINNSHTDIEVYVTSGTNQLNLRSDKWSLDSSIKSNLHNLNGKIEILGVTYTVTSLVETATYIRYSVTPNPRVNGLTTNGNRSVTTTYDTSTGATLNFTGAIANGNQSVTINNNDATNSGAGRRWNLIANPFASYLNGNSNADGTHNFLTINTAALDDNFEAIYGWNSSGYTIYNNTSSATYIAPGQGFFVAAAGSGEDQTISFTKAMQTIVGTDDFIASKTLATSYELVLEMHQDTKKLGDTKFYFKEGLTLGLDPGYDAGAFNQGSALSSRLLAQDNGINMGINAMSLDHMNSITVPLVINQEAGTPFAIRIANHTLPSDINVYVEDVVEKTVTLVTAQSF